MMPESPQRCVRLPTRLPKRKRPKLAVGVQLRLWVKAGGRCQFGGCNEELLRDALTLRETNYADIAHIVSWDLGGPRGTDALPLDQRNKLENLMLACRKHHRLIDSKEHEADFSTAGLRAMKFEHEARIRRLTAIHPTAKSVVVRVQTRIGRDDVSVSLHDIDEALYPRYRDEQVVDVDLRDPRAPDAARTWAAEAANIDAQLERVFATLTGHRTPERMAIFALAPMPLLMHLGSRLSNKVPTDLFQRHRNPESWAWQTDASSAAYMIRTRRTGVDTRKVAVLLSLSGVISLERLPADLSRDVTVLELTLDGRAPDPAFLRAKGDLDAFVTAYQALLARAKDLVVDLSEIHLFPAVPAPVAVACGRELLPKVHPRVIVYDDNKNAPSFMKALEVN
jgi:hypothetical protein